MRQAKPAWRRTLKSLLCDHVWETIGWAMDDDDRLCAAEECAACGRRRQTSADDAAVSARNATVRRPARVIPHDAAAGEAPRH